LDELLTVQYDLSSFKLARISFNFIADGTGMFGLFNTTLGDYFGRAFTSLTTIKTPYFVTSGNSVDVAEPASIVLILIALTLLIKQRKVSF
jgi:hypothetical protein